MTFQLSFFLMKFTGQRLSCSFQGVTGLLKVSCCCSVSQTHPSHTTILVHFPRFNVLGYAGVLVRNNSPTRVYLDREMFTVMDTRQIIIDVADSHRLNITATDILNICFTLLRNTSTRCAACAERR